MAQAASKAGVDPRSLSFKHTVQLWTVEWREEFVRPRTTSGCSR